MKPKKPKPKLRKHRFLVGYPTEKDAVYGRRVLARTAKPNWAVPMTAHQAKRFLKQLPWSNATIFELVEVKGTDK